ncbi:MAG: AAA family ATPase [Saprospiraceae bacterium]|nr:AAA family ATPase [Candidatus Vicinibacter affinis]MBP6173665.1 AAA family ATPase [Saprospiraceae bacterium]
MSIINHFNHLNLSQGQETALAKLEAFLAGPANVFMLKGYAGSGKTAILKGLVDYFNTSDKDFALMAPTGRAAKVIREKTGQEAFTIHKSIYSYEDMVEIEEGDSFYYYYKIRNNIDVTGKIFIVDEASMLSDANNESEFFRFGSGHLLSDLITYTRVAHENVKSKIIFVGDPCQLSPVGDNSSKAFEANYLKEHFNLSSEETEMKEVQRQGGDSGILRAAAKIRKSISAHFFNDFNLRSNGNDILNPSYEAFLDIWQESASPKIIIASKNKTCLDLNLQIRERIFGNANLPVQKSDIVIMGGNNYRKGVFNGEFAVINEVSDTVTQRTIALRAKNSITLYWRDVELIFPDAESNNKVVKGKMLENFIYGDNYLKPEETQALYVDFTSRHKGLKPKTEEFKEAIMQDEYFNCLLMKYGYAVTCHKAQGGEWDNVFTVWDNDNMEGFDCFTDKQRRASKTNQDFYRWAYTAITRASKTLYALNPPFFNSYSSMAFLDVTVLNALNELTGNQVQTEEINLDNELLQQLSVLNLLEQPVPLQDHFIKVRHAVRKQYIDIVGWEKIGYEIRYSFLREKDKAVFKTFVNGKYEFRNAISPMPNLSPSSTFNNTLAEILNHLPNVSIKRNTAETIISQIEFDFELEEEFPFTRSLFDELVLLFKETDIKIDDIEHQQYKERYTFKRNNETAVVDFEYKKNGFFGRIVPIQNMTNSQLLLTSLQTALQTFKQEEYAG